MKKYTVNDFKTVGQLISTVRKDANISQNKLAAEINKKQSHISGMENDRNGVLAVTLFEVIEALGYDIVIQKKSKGLSNLLG